ncbi:hypothetical protein EDB87DRAFT_118152 [Lactarius vividus]|nr:hypothetical protein EDB87DRAFT_118152 [Lactarius vividus]
MLCTSLMNRSDLPAHSSCRPRQTTPLSVIFSAMVTFGLTKIMDRSLHDNPRMTQDLHRSLRHRNQAGITTLESPETRYAPSTTNICRRYVPTIWRGRWRRATVHAEIIQNLTPWCALLNYGNNPDRLIFSQYSMVIIPRTLGQKGIQALRDQRGLGSCISRKPRNSTGPRDRGL